MDADGLQDFQIGRIFPPDKLEIRVGIRAMRARVAVLECTEPFTGSTRRREHRVISLSQEKIRRASTANQAQLRVFASRPLHSRVVPPARVPRPRRDLEGNIMPNATVIALHCSLGSGRQWARLAEALGDGYQLIAPDLSGYGRHLARPIMPVTLADEVALLGEQLEGADGPIHLVGHYYGGAVAFKMAT